MLLGIRDEREKVLLGIDEGILNIYLVGGDGALDRIVNFCGQILKY